MSEDCHNPDGSVPCVAHIGSPCPCQKCAKPDPNLYSYPDGVVRTWKDERDKFEIELREQKKLRFLAAQTNLELTEEIMNLKKQVTIMAFLVEELKKARKLQAALKSPDHQDRLQRTSCP